MVQNDQIPFVAFCLKNDTWLELLLCLHFAPDCGLILGSGVRSHKLHPHFILLQNSERSWWPLLGIIF